MFTLGIKLGVNALQYLSGVVLGPFTIDRTITTIDSTAFTIDKTVI